MRKDIQNEKFLVWALSFDKTDHTKYVKYNMKPFEVLFLDVGAQILKNMSGFLVASPDKAVQKIRKDVVRAIKTVQKSKDVKKINTLKAQIDKLEAIGGLSSIVPQEGVVFKYKGKTYKFTGAFAPVNQIVGLLNFQEQVMAGYSKENERQNKALKSILKGQAPEERVMVGYEGKKDNTPCDKIDRLS